MADPKSIQIWEEAWQPEIHKTDYALKRITSAKSAKLTPLKIDTIDFYGYFQGGHGRYETFLNYCPCGDFYRSKLPCKHIYRLAMELGLMNEEFQHNTHAIVTPKSERISLDKTIDIVEKLSENAQHLLLGIASNIRSTTPIYETSLDDTIIELINSGIVIDTDPQNHKINFRTKSAIMDLLDKENIPYDKKAKKKVLEEICLKHIPQAATKAFGETICVSIPSIFSPQNIHYYLYRKYESEIFYDENMNYYKISLLGTVLPDDAITDQLIARGYYSRKEN